MVWQGHLVISNVCYMLLDKVGTCQRNLARVCPGKSKNFAEEKERTKLFLQKEPITVSLLKLEKCIFFERRKNEKNLRREKKIYAIKIVL